MDDDFPERAKVTLWVYQDGRITWVEGDGDTRGIQVRAPHVSSGLRRRHKRPAVVRIRLHTLVCRAFHGPMPEDKVLIRHLDDDKANNTPANLAYGTVKENGEDAVRNGKSPRGESNWRAKLTEAQVIAIRADQRTGVAIAAEYGVSHNAVSCIKHRKTWKHVP